MTSQLSLETLIGRSSIEDIVLSKRGLCFFEGGLWEGPFPSQDTEEAALKNLARYIAEASGATLGFAQPSVDAFLQLGASQVFRAHVVIPPLAPLGMEITLRRLSHPETLSIQSFRASPEVHEQIFKAVQNKDSILIAGATGSGKTSLLTALLATLPSQTRILILEDSPELALPNALSSKLLARCDRFGFRAGAIWDLSHLVFESLRMRPDRLILGECRGQEAFAVAQALKTGHRGVMTTLHAGSPAAALQRFSELAALGRGSKNLDPQEDANLWDLVVQLEQRQEERTIKELYWTRCSKVSN